MHALTLRLYAHVEHAEWKKETYHVFIFDSDHETEDLVEFIESDFFENIIFNEAEQWYAYRLCIFLGKFPFSWEIRAEIQNYSTWHNIITTVMR